MRLGIRGVTSARRAVATTRFRHARSPLGVTPTRGDWRILTLETSPGPTRAREAHRRPRIRVHGAPSIGPVGVRGGAGPATVNRRARPMVFSPCAPGAAKWVGDPFARQSLRDRWMGLHGPECVLSPIGSLSEAPGTRLRSCPVPWGSAFRSAPSADRGTPVVVRRAGQEFTGSRERRWSIRRSGAAPASGPGCRTASSSPRARRRREGNAPPCRCRPGPRTRTAGTW